MLNSPDSMFEGIGDCKDPCNVVTETKSEIENPNSVIGESSGHDDSVKEMGSLRNGSEEKVETSKIVVAVGKREVDTPPTDDCCPICFGDFTIACKTNCGHWFCATCILQFWNYRAALQKCKCPICSRLISKLTPEASLLILQEEEVIQVLKNVQRYNDLFQGGAHGLMRLGCRRVQSRYRLFRLDSEYFWYARTQNWLVMSLEHSKFAHKMYELIGLGRKKVLELPLVFKRMFQGLMDPDRLRVNYYTMRVVALLLSCMYNMSPFDFIPTGGLGARRLFDLCAITLVAILCLVGVFRRVMLRHRVRLLADAQF